MKMYEKLLSTFDNGIKVFIVLKCSWTSLCFSLRERFVSN